MTTKEEWLALAERVRARSVCDPNTGCLIWSGAKSSAGYGQIWHGPARRIYLTHRVMCAAYHGEITPGGMACHTCDTPSCCNPDHLYIGNVKTNAADMAARGRSYIQKNPDKQRALAAAGGRAMGGRNLFAKGKHPSAKLTIVDVKAIRDSQQRARDIAVAYGVSRKTIESIRRGETWAKI